MHAKLLTDTCLLTDKSVNRQGQSQWIVAYLREFLKVLILGYKMPILDCTAVSWHLNCILLLNQKY